MTSLNERLAGEGTTQDVQYEEESVHNALVIAQNTVISVIKKVKDNVLCIITAPVIVLQLDIL